MRFSTSNSTLFLHNSAPNQSISSSFKKILSTITSKLPNHHSQKVNTCGVDNKLRLEDKTTLLATKRRTGTKNDRLLVKSTKNNEGNKVKAMSSNLSNKSAISNDDTMYENLRQYYSTQNEDFNSRKRQLIETDSITIVGPLDEKKKKMEREMRHKTVKQYQQTEPIKKSICHWKEHSKLSINNNNAPSKFKTHDYVRVQRSNPDYLRIKALKACSHQLPAHDNKSFLKKRNDEFIWGNPSKLRECTN